MNLMKRHLPLITLTLLLLALAGLMIGPAREETATVDETTFMGGGYGYFQTGSTKMGEENPLLVQMLMAVPMLAMDVTISKEARAVMEQQAFSPVGRRWRGGMAALRDLFPSGITFYHYGLAEAQHFGRILVYDPHNRAEVMLFWARFVQILFTLGTAVFVFLWASQLAGNAWAGVGGAALWVFNPNALAYGHLAITEPGLTLMFPVTVWWFVKTVGMPTTRRVIILGVLCALTMQMKYLALMLGPLFIVMLLIGWLREKTVAPVGLLAKRVALVGLGFWVTLLVIFFPHWSPPPPIEPGQAEVLGVPGWFVAFRPLLMPGEFFKSVALKLLHSQAGHDAFLCGKWSDSGWWYYYPAAMCYKTPLVLLALIAISVVLICRRAKTATLAELAPWIAAAVYLASALTSKVDIGVRHVLPVYPMLAVGIAVEFWRLGRNWKIGGVIGAAWLAGVAVTAAPDFIAYTNECGGGTANGYKVLLDSNYDWGQDGRRLKAWMQANHVPQIYLDFFGTQTALEWHQIPNQHVTAETARQIHQGVLVVSISNLMREEWRWLRESRSPSDRVGYTLFVYRFP